LKYLFISALVSAAFFAGRYTAGVALPGLPSALPVAAPGVPAATAAQRAEAVRVLKTCRDECDQNALLSGANDLQLKACRARCDADHLLPVVPHETPRSISVAPADHR
jgi:hypothetical protein